MKIQTSVRVEDEFYQEAKGDAVNLFLSRVSMEQGIHFSITAIQKNKKDNNLMKSQEISMSKTWDNKEDEAWDEI